MTAKQLALLICLFIGGALASSMISKNKEVEQVKNCNRHGGIGTTVIIAGDQYLATKYNVTCKDGSTYNHESRKFRWK